MVRLGYDVILRRTATMGRQFAAMIAAMTPVADAVIGTLTFNETPNAEETNPPTVPRQTPMMTIWVRFLDVSTFVMSGNSSP
jgi:hypothetical protein